MVTITIKPGSEATPCATCGSPQIAGECFAPDCDGEPDTQSGPTGPGDESIPCNVPAAATHATNPKFYFLSEIGADCLASFLQSVADANADGDTTSVYWGATLVVDQAVELATPLILPGWFTLSGVGINGAGRLLFKNLGAQPAIIMQQGLDVPNDGYTRVHDLFIENIGGCDTGILLNGINTSNNCFFENVLIRGFEVAGVRSEIETYYIHFRDCIFENNATHVILTFACNGWRFTGCDFRSSSQWAIVVETINDLMVDGCNFLNNEAGGVRVVGGLQESFGVIIVGSRFQNNGGVAVSVEDNTLSARIIGNLLVGNDWIVDFKSLSGANDPFSRGHHETQVGFNSKAEMNLQLGTQYQECLYAFTETEN